jgi:iron complex transport system ATP-binding protein
VLPLNIKVTHKQPISKRTEVNQLTVAVQNVTFHYRNTPTLTQISLELQKTQLLGMIGPNGSGKTTLLKCMNKILEPKQGKILLDAQELKKMNRMDVAKHIGYVPQSAVANLTPLPVFEVVLMGRRPHIGWQNSETDNEKAWAALKLLNIESLSMRDFYELSGGEQQRVLIARAIAQEAKVLLLDEPTSSLDIRHQLEVMDLIRKLIKEKDLAAAVAIHDLNLAARFCDQVVMMKKGQIFATGETQAVLSPENIRAVYGVEAIVNYSNSFPYIIPLNPCNQTP